MSAEKNLFDHAQELMDVGEAIQVMVDRAEAQDRTGEAFLLAHIQKVVGAGIAIDEAENERFLQKRYPKIEMVK